MSPYSEKMLEVKFSRFAELPSDLQREAIREGEELLSAQLDVASDADRRALSWIGFILTAAIAALAAGFTLVTKEPRNFQLGSLALTVGVLLLSAAWLAILSVKPEQFCLPGSDPENWLPSEWDCTGDESEKIGRAYQEQAFLLSIRIKDNMGSAARRAKLLTGSIGTASFAIFAAACCLSLYALS
jgi:hypothetical protein